MNTYKKVMQLLSVQRWNLAAASCGLLCSLVTSAVPSVSEGYLLQSLPGSSASHPSSSNVSSTSSRPPRTSLRMLRLQRRLARLQNRHAAAPASRPAAPVVVKKSVVAMADDGLHLSAPEAASSVASSVDARPAASETVPESAPAPAPVSSSAAPEAPPAPDPAFPPFLHASFPVAAAANWGAMHTPEVWNRSYDQMTPADFVPIPAYDLRTLTIPMSTLTDPLLEKNIPTITAKLFYSTRFFGAYDVDSGEFVTTHAGVDIKTPLKQPVLAVGGGRVVTVVQDQTFGLHVVIEHRLPEGTFYSIYGHLGAAFVRRGDTVTPGQAIGAVGMTGNTTGPHLHLQIDRGHGETDHQIYLPSSPPGPGEADKWVVNPIRFIAEHRNG
jgi:murein DD-endopeptidase MepM/ murein hydrolase activator NlpD